MKVAVLLTQWKRNNLKIQLEQIKKQTMKPDVIIVFQNENHINVDYLKDEYDLKLYIQGYRLQRLVRGDYKMGFMTLHNGSIYVDRDNKEFTELESYFWKWAFLETKFNLKPQ